MPKGIHPRKGRPAVDRFMEKINYDLEVDCFMWGGGLNKKGYGQFRVDGKTHLAYKWLWEYLNNGPVPKGFELDHAVCGIRCCVCPSHLQVTTGRENVIRGKKLNRNKTSKYTGVCWAKARNKWKAQIRINGKKKNLGFFDSEQDANMAYVRARLEIEESIYPEV